MKKRLSTIILAALTGAMLVSTVPAMAAGTSAGNYSEQYVTQEDGHTVVYTTYYVDPDDAIAGQTVTWYDGNGTKYVSRYIAKQAEPEIISQTVTWKDASGNTYVRDVNAHTVTVYDVNGNVIAVINE